MCGKEIFESENNVRNAIRLIKNAGRNTKNGGYLRHYFCKDCKGFHITSMRPEKRKATIKRINKFYNSN